jgi:hypothetical protein
VGALPFVAPLTPFMERIVNPEATEGCVGDVGLSFWASCSMSTSMGCCSLILDKADSLLSCSGGRFNGCELGSKVGENDCALVGLLLFREEPEPGRRVSSLPLFDLKKDFLVGDGDLLDSSSSRSVEGFFFDFLADLEKKLIWKLCAKKSWVASFIAAH